MVEVQGDCSTDLGQQTNFPCPPSYPVLPSNQWLVVGWPSTVVAAVVAVVVVAAAAVVVAVAVGEP